MVKYGNTDLYVSRICQGTAFRNMPRSHDNKIGLFVLRHCLDMGLNFFDTTAGYGTGGSERLLGKAISGYRDKAIIANRVINQAVPIDAKEDDTLEPAKYTREYIFQSTEWSLKRLNTDYIDILSVHLKDGLSAREDKITRDKYIKLHKDPASTSSEEIADTMNTLVKSGKIRYWSLSQYGHQDISNYLQISRNTGKPPIASLQNSYNILSQRESTETLFPLIRRANLGVQTIATHAAGMLVPGYNPEPGSRHESLLKSLDQVSAELGVPRSQVCVAWVLSHPELTTALSGAKSPEHVEDNMSGASLKLPDGALKILNSARKTYRLNVSER